MDRPLTSDEYNLARWLLEHGKPEALDFLPQLDGAKASSWTCPCGCASFYFEVDVPRSAGELNTLAHFEFGEGEALWGLMIWERNGKLNGVGIYGMPWRASKALPSLEYLSGLLNS